MPCMYVCLSGVCAHEYYFLSVCVHVCLCVCVAACSQCAVPRCSSTGCSAWQCSAYFLIEFTDVDDQICSNQFHWDGTGVHVLTDCA